MEWFPIYGVLDIPQEQKIKKEPSNLVHEVAIAISLTLMNSSLNTWGIASQGCQKMCMHFLLTPGGSRVKLKKMAQFPSSRGSFFSFRMAFSRVKDSLTVIVWTCGMSHNIFRIWWVFPTPVDSIMGKYWSRSRLYYITLYYAGMNQSNIGNEFLAGLLLKKCFSNKPEIRINLGLNPS